MTKISSDDSIVLRAESILNRIQETPNKEAYNPNNIITNGRKDARRMSSTFKLETILD